MTVLRSIPIWLLRLSRLSWYSAGTAIDTCLEKVVLLEIEDRPEQFLQPRGRQIGRNFLCEPQNDFEPFAFLGLIVPRNRIVELPEPTPT